MKSTTESTKEPNTNKPKRTQKKLLNELFTSIGDGDVENVRNAIDKGVPVNTALPNKYLPITYAAHCGYPEIVKLLIDAGADVDTWDDNYYLPLVQILSSPRKHVREDVEAIVKMLIEAGASVNRREGVNGHGDTPLVKAINEFVHPRVIKMLIDAGANVEEKRGADTPPIAWALWNLGSHSDKAKSLSYEERLEVVKILLAAGADVSIGDLLYYSVGNIPALEFFLNQQGADVNELLWRATENAAYYNDFASLEFLLKRGADINARYKDGETCLFKAVRVAEDKPRIDTVKFLIEHGADINVQGGEFEITPLIQAVWGHNPEMMEYLLEQGADTTLKTNEGETVMDIAKRVDKMNSYCDGEIENPFHGRVALLKKHHVV